MRVIAGSRRSIPLKAVEGRNTRPTTDRIKETLFNMLNPYLDGCRFLDLFAGSGAIGIEALSRGAEYACFVENAADACQVIKYNLNKTRFGAEARLVRSDVFRFLSGAAPEKPFDLVFMDPPYGLDLEKKVLCGDWKEGWFGNDALFVIEASLQTDLSWLQEEGYTVVKDKIYKINRHIFCRRSII